MASRRGMSIKKFFVIIAITAIVVAGGVLAAIWFSGMRYINYKTTLYGESISVGKYIGKLNEASAPCDGTVYFPDGSKAELSYQGGTLTFNNGDVLTGEFFALAYEDGTSYIGELSGLLRSGSGSLTFNGGDLYQGEFYYGEMTGHGTYYYKNGDIYEGELENGVKSGEGSYIWFDGDGKTETYVGQYKNNMRNGEGVYTYADGTVYSGTYENDAKNGIGTMKFASGDVYEGEFVGDLRSGKGKYTFASGDVYEGDFFRGTITGYGKYHWASGERPDYDGYFENGKIVVVVPEVTAAAPTTEE